VDLVLHLRYFLVVAEELHFGRAAARLHMSQPPLSQRIQRLEREYGAALFDRSGGRVRLTAAGEALVPEAREIVERVAASRLTVKRAVDEAPASLVAGVPPDTAGGVLASLVAAYATAVPDTRLEFRAATTAEQIPLLRRGVLDVAILQLPVDADGLRLGPVARSPVGVMLSRLSPLAGRTEIALADLDGHRLVTPPREFAPGRHDETVEACRRHGFTPTEIRYAVNSEFLLAAVVGGDTVALDDGTVASKEPRVVFRPLTGTPIVWRVRAAWTTDSGYASRFGDVVARVLARDVPLPGRPGTVTGPKPWNVVFPYRLAES
jgi:DNA-binding transcriptional LysR family regulator